MGKYFNTPELFHFRKDVLAYRGLSLNAKVIFSWMLVCNYKSQNDGFIFNPKSAATMFGLTYRKVENAILNLVKKKWISMCGAMWEQSILVFINEELINEIFPNACVKEPVRTATEQEKEEELLEEMVRNARGTYKKHMPFSRNK